MNKILENQKLIALIKRKFQDYLSEALNLQRVSAPLFVDKKSGVQDNLNGIENPVSFNSKNIDDGQFEIVHSLAKWKRQALKRYGLDLYSGIYTDMNALRPDEEDLTTGIHSIYVDQWDWEQVISPEDRNLDYLKKVVKSIYQAIRKTEEEVSVKSGIAGTLTSNIEFVHSEDLLYYWPNLNKKEREDKIAKELGSVFLIGIGGNLQNGQPHDGRAPDYDDWTTQTGVGKHGLNGDIIVWNERLEQSFEVSSMGIRVDADTLKKQLEIRECSERAEFPWHKALLSGELPQSIGGGIGQSRLCMLLLQKQHIGEVQVSVWPKSVQEYCKSVGINLL